MSDATRTDPGTCQRTTKLPAQWKKGTFGGLPNGLVTIAPVPGSAQWFASGQFAVTGRSVTLESDSLPLLVDKLRAEGWEPYAPGGQMEVFHDPESK